MKISNVAAGAGIKLLERTIILTPGLVLVLIIAVTAGVFGTFFPLVGASVFGIIIGIIINSLIAIPENTGPGVDFSSKSILQFSIILLGSTLSFNQITKTGASSFFVMLFTIPAAFIIAFGAGKLLKVDTPLKSLIGAGTAICGGSAIAAVSSVIDADEHDISYSISTIFLFNVIAVMIFPPLGHLFGLSDYGFGLLSGTAINDTSSVVAAGYIFSNTAGDFAAIVKLTRTTMIIPVSLAFMAYTLFTRKKGSASAGDLKFSIVKIFPWFILGFIGMALINSTGIIDQTFSSGIKDFAKFMIVMALSAIGLKTNVSKMIHTGPKPLLLGLFTWLAVIVTSVAVQIFTRQL